MSQSVTINLPEGVYERIKQLAIQTNRTVEDELLTLVTTVMPVEEPLNAELTNAVAGLALLDDKTLWQAARTHLTAKVVTRMERLHYKRQSEGLAENEVQELGGLVKEYEKRVLIRAEAMGLLMERGFDVSKLIKSPRG